jgi:hypothetical protein
MTTTTLYRLGTYPGQIGECQNSWRGAMYVWTDIARRYCGFETFPMFDEVARNRVWNVWRSEPMPLHDAVVLLSTMDYATISARDVPAVANAFEMYGRNHPESSLCEQAALLRAARFEDGDVVAWRQTSVSEFWGETWLPEPNDDGDEAKYYDPAKGDRHFDAYAEALEAAQVLTV